MDEVFMSRCKWNCTLLSGCTYSYFLQKKTNTKLGEKLKEPYKSFPTAKNKMNEFVIRIIVFFRYTHHKYDFCKRSCFKRKLFFARISKEFLMQRERNVFSWLRLLFSTLVLLPLISFWKQLPFVKMRNVPHATILTPRPKDDELLLWHSPKGHLR